MRVKNGWAERQPFAWWSGEWHEGNIMASMLVPTFGGVIVGAVTDQNTTGPAPLFAMLAFWSLFAFVIFGHHLSGLNRVDNTTGQVGGTRYSYYDRGFGSADLLRKIIKLPKKDQQLFPPDLVQTLAQNLLPSERKKINEGIYATLQKIEERDKHLADVEMRAIPTEHVLAALADAKRNVESDIEVYKEFL